jgi:Ca2+-binding EF-hand superfamily protein
MNTKMLLAAVCGAAIAIPALAAGMHEMHEHMSGPMTRSTVEAKVKEHFAKVDANGDGYIVKAEADAAHDKMKSEMRDRHFKTMDTNGDGSISRAEFDSQHHEGTAMGESKPGGPAMRAMMDHGPGHGPAMSMMMRRGGDMFGRADADKDGRVSLAEALAMPMAHFDKADTNKDGTISPEERKAAHEKMRAEWRGKHG